MKHSTNYPACPTATSADDQIKTGERIARLRVSAKLNREDFARLIGCPPEALPGYENGTVSLPLTTIKSIAVTFSASEEWLCSGNGISPIKGQN